MGYASLFEATVGWSAPSPATTTRIIMLFYKKYKNVVIKYIGGCLTTLTWTMGSMQTIGNTL